MPWEMCLALRGENVALIYTPTGRTLDIQLAPLSTSELHAFWFDPRTGDSTPLGSFKGQSRQRFDPPGNESPGNDWVLLLRKESP